MSETVGSFTHHHDQAGTIRVSWSPAGEGLSIAQQARAEQAEQTARRVVRELFEVRAQALAVGSDFPLPEAIVVERTPAADHQREEHLAFTLTRGIGQVTNLMVNMGHPGVVKKLGFDPELACRYIVQWYLTTGWERLLLDHLISCWKGYLEREGANRDPFIEQGMKALRGMHMAIEAQKGVN